MIGKEYSSRIQVVQAKGICEDLKMKIQKIFHELSNIMAWISGIMVFLMAALTFISVITRYFFNAPLSGSQEIMEMAMAIVLYFGLPYAVYKRKMIIVDAIISKIPRVPREILAGICSFLCIIMSGLFAYKLIETGISYYGRGLATGVLKLPYWPMYFLCAFANVMLFVEQIYDGIRHFKDAKKQENNRGEVVSE